MSTSSGRRRPAPADLRRGGRYGTHVCPSVADDRLIYRLVEAVFAPQPTLPSQPALPDTTLEQAAR